MVVAEVPLWVVHVSGSSAPIGGSNDQSRVDSDKDTSSSRASNSLSLLQSLGGVSKKCAIYSLDVHPSGKKFATGGGDGTVRLWNTSALFAKRRGTFNQNGKYESSDSSDSQEGSGTDDDAMTAGDKDQKKKAAEYKGDQDAEVEDTSNSADQPSFHDLNQVVRRKKDWSTPSDLPRVSPAMKSSPQQKHEGSASNNHRLICTLSAHTGSSVLAVRFSTTGNYLASAGDDAVVCVYAPTSGFSASGNLSDSVEHWSRIKLCRGHTLDAVGLAWAPDDSHLVSCSLDSDAPIIVWKLTDLEPQQRRTQSNVLCNPYKILGKGIHTSTVKGVTFDPAGSYLASSGDDPAVCIWRAHDDWGLEKRIDDSTGIFRRWKEEDVRELSSQTLFRRISWSTDGTYVCSTNGTIKNRHVASTISREGWSVSTCKSAASGAANLVGHKHPIVVSRHCPVLIDARKKSDNNDNDDEEPDYATLVALGDKGGLLTVWSTRKSRPIFKLQCSESRCTITDLAWGKQKDGIVLLVSLFDGQVVALWFAVPKELGIPLNEEGQKHVFQLRYGMDFDDDNGIGRRRIFVGDSSGPKLIENALQFALEDKEDQDMGEQGSLSGDDIPLSSFLSASKQKSTQVESRSKGKKRIRPLLLTVADGAKPPKQNGAEGKESSSKKKKATDPVKDALESAAKAASAADEIATSYSKQAARQEFVGETSQDTDHPGSAPQQQQQHHHHRMLPPLGAQHSLRSVQIPYSTERIHSIDLPLRPSASLDTSKEGTDDARLVADCTNSTYKLGGSGQPLPCVLISISRGGHVQRWRDMIVGTSCTAVAASRTMLAIGTADGCVYLYGTSSMLGWSSGSGFRSHPPLVFGQPIVSLQLNEGLIPDTTEKSLEMLVVTSDGSFGVYGVVPDLTLLYKGSILPPMTHMILSSNRDSPLPKLARIQTTGSGRLLMILSLQASTSSRSDDNRSQLGRSGHATPSVGPGGSLQAFAYNRSLQVWMRISDSRFLLSDFYSTLPKSKGTGKTNFSHALLSKMDDAVRGGSSASSIKPSRRGRAVSSGESGGASSIYGYPDQDTNVVTRSHCEDRLACALALESASEFRHWLSMYVRNLTQGGNETQLRLLVDLLLVDAAGTMISSAGSSCWWLSSAPTILDLSRQELVKTAVIPEMSKNRALQRLTSEISMEAGLS